MLLFVTRNSVLSLGSRKELKVRVTPLGRIVFICITGSTYSYPQGSIIASPEQAVSDFIYLCRKLGVSPSDIVTFRNLHRLDLGLLQARLMKYPTTVKRETERLLKWSG